MSLTNYAHHHFHPRWRQYVCRRAVMVTCRLPVWPLTVLCGTSLYTCLSKNFLTVSVLQYNCNVLLSIRTAVDYYAHKPGGDRGYHQRQKKRHWAPQLETPTTRSWTPKHVFEARKIIRSVTNEASALNYFFTSKDLDLLFLVEMWLRVDDLSAFSDMCPANCSLFSSL